MPFANFQNAFVGQAKLVSAVRDLGPVEAHAAAIDEPSGFSVARGESCKDNEPLYPDTIISFFFFRYREFLYRIRNFFVDKDTVELFFGSFGGRGTVLLPRNLGHQRPVRLGHFEAPRRGEVSSIRDDIGRVGDLPSVSVSLLDTGVVMAF